MTCGKHDYYLGLHGHIHIAQPPFTTQRLPLPWRHLGDRIPLTHSNTVEYGWTLRGPSALTRQLLGYFATRDLLGRGVKRPHVITRERMAAERRATPRSKSSRWDDPKDPLNFTNEVTCQVKVRSNVKIGAFRLQAVETTKLSVLGQNLLRILRKYRVRYWLSKCLILCSVQGQDQVTKAHHT